MMSSHRTDSPLSTHHERHKHADSFVDIPLSESARSSDTYSDTPTEIGGPMSPTEDDEYMASLLARLEMENDALATDPKAGITSVFSSQQYETMLDEHTSNNAQSVYIPKEALGMSLGDFWALVTSNYAQALAVMPTMTPVMIRKGVPDFLRPVVWVGLAEARDEKLYAEYDALLERLDYEDPNLASIIDKDVNRCFPNHELFVEPEGEGQKMLGQVLKCYNFHDPETGYCQGMGFIVGILLMKMDARDAFCVFVKLMENHGLRSSYSKSLSGLHSRIYQFQQLLSPLSPKLLAHFRNLGVEFAYLSQWFMTLFATTCPLDTLFRIYDIVLAEGADETIMRVALALILRNEEKLLAMTEIEDVLSMLLSREIWEPYDEDAGQLIEEVTTRFENSVTRESLDELHQQFLARSETGVDDKTVRALGFTSSHFSAFKIFDNWWSPTKSTSILPGTVLKRTASKQSLATLNSMSGGSGPDSLASTDSYASTAPTEVDRGMERDVSTPSILLKAVQQQDKNLHEQVEGLLMALSEVQREAAQTAADLQREQERRNKAQHIVGDLVQLLHQKKTVDAYRRQRRTTLPSRIRGSKTQAELKELARRSNFVKTVTKSVIAEGSDASDRDAGLQASLLRLCALFDAEQSLAHEVDERADAASTTSGQDLDMERHVQSLENELERLRGRVLRDRTRRHVKKTSEMKDAYVSSSTKVAESPRTRRNLYRRREPKVFKARDASGSPVETSLTIPRLRPHEGQSRSASPTMPRPKPPPRMIISQDGSELPAPQKFKLQETLEPPALGSFAKRTSSLASREVLATVDNQPPPEETLLVELVSAKTREATAIHERDEMKVQLDKRRKAYEAREAEMKAKLESMEALLTAQTQAHAVELEKYRLSPATPGSSALFVQGTLAAGPVTPEGARAGWGWFSKGRSVSTGNAMA